MAGFAPGISLGHDPEKWIPIFPRDKREAFARRLCSNKNIERDAHRALCVDRIPLQAVLSHEFAFS